MDLRKLVPRSLDRECDSKSSGLANRGKACSEGPRTASASAGFARSVKDA
jgi:hypothetical protein